jgi:tetratricopeptide (TPR) repeat protein
MTPYPLRLKPGAGILLTCLLCIHACTTAYQSRQAQDSVLDNLPQAVELTETPFFPQTEHHCGPAALATVLQSHSVDVTPEKLASLVYIPQRKGSLQIEMAVAARRYGMLPYPLQPELSDLLKEIAAGNPVLVLQNLGFDWWPRWHYAVVIGYDISRRELILRSGTTKRWLTSFATFENTWKRADKWSLVIVPAGKIPETAAISAYLHTAHALEETGLNFPAVKAYRAAATQWPDDTTVWITLGNMEYKAGNYDKAVSALIKASELSPQTVMVWNNLAYALHAAGCPEQALQSLQCAYQLSPADGNIRDSEQEISNLAVASRAEQCPDIECSQ